MNAWELLLKAFVRKYVKDKNIFESNGHTISFDKALSYTAEYINGQLPESFVSIQENLLIIENYRNKVAHFYNEPLEPYILYWYFRGFADEISPLLRYVSPLPEKPSYYMPQYGVNYNPE